MFKMQLKGEGNNYKWLLAIVVIFFISVAVIIALYFIFEKNYQNKIYPKVYLGDIMLGGQTKGQAQQIINEKINIINQQGIIFYYRQQQAVILPIITTTEGDWAYEIINFETKKTINQAFNFGRENTFFVNLKEKIKALLYHQPINLQFTINEKEIIKILEGKFYQFENPAQDAKLIYNNGLFTTQEETGGKLVDYEKAIRELKIKLAQLGDLKIKLFTKTDYPRIYKKDCLNIENSAMKILQLSPIELILGQKKWIIKKDQLANWLTLKIAQGEQKNKKIIVGLNQEAIEQFFQDEIEPAINKEPMNAKFTIQNGRVVEFQASTDGQQINRQASFDKIEDELINKKSKTVELIITELKSLVHTKDTNKLGISEIVGTGQSDFAGSPTNRQHNIKTGAETLNGILIKPSQEFSLIKALGKTDGSAGYLPELVIKGNETIPEYGGGLCQIGTTIFRAAIASGLPITARRNHSYRVSYYEPAGKDAAIYDPWPDVCFINDASNHILIQSRIEGSNLFFDFWGTKDGRIIEQTDSVIYNIVKPGPTKYIETLDLPVDEEKCTEHAHNGADAYFDYKVTYPDGEIKEERFYSHYVPWQEVCLIGVEELSNEADNNQIATTTKEEILKR